MSGLTIGGVAISHPDKLWWPDEDITKEDIVRYYDAVWPRLRPWVRDRPLTAERCPDGIRGSCFYQKNFAPDAAPTEAPRLRQRAASTGRDVSYLVGGARSTLLTMTNLGCIAVHVMAARTDAIDRPDWMAFDLDPTTGSFADAAKAGRALRILLDELGLRSFPKTSGSRGLHVFVPLRRGATSKEVTAVASAIGEELARREPRLVTAAHSKAARGQRVYADAFRNGAWQTVAAPYSVRRRPGAPVSTPLDWDEVRPNLDPARWNVRTIGRRLAKNEPWADFWKARQRLPASSVLGDMADT